MVSSETPTLEKVIQMAVDLRVQEIHTSLPGIVERYDASKQLADVQPALMKRYKDGRLVQLPLITNVSVKHPRANGAIIHLPLKKGDVVTLNFSERSLDKWLNEGGVVDPDDTRKHALSDAWAYPGGYPFSDPLTIAEPDKLTIQYGSSEIRIGEDGDVSLGDHALLHPAARGDSVQARLSALETKLATHMTIYTAHVHATAAPGAPSPPIPIETPFIADPSIVESGKVKVD